MKRKWLVLPLIAVLATLAVAAFLVWCVEEDALTVVVQQDQGQGAVQVSAAVEDKSTGQSVSADVQAKASGGATSAAVQAQSSGESVPVRRRPTPRAQDVLDVAPPDTQAGDRAVPAEAVGAAVVPVAPPGNNGTPGSVGADASLLLPRRTDPAAGAREVPLPSEGRPLRESASQRQPGDSGGAETARPEEADLEAPAPAHEADLVTDVPAADLRGLGLKLRREEDGGALTKERAGQKWLVLTLVAALATLAVVALLVWCVAKDARQAALLDARVQQAEDRVTQARDRYGRLRQDKAPAEEVRQAEREWVGAEAELDLLRFEREQRRREEERRHQSWPARLRQEVKRRTGW
jgi:hypothetical protein